MTENNGNDPAGGSGGSGGGTATIMLADLIPRVGKDEAEYINGCLKSGIDTPEKLVKRAASLHNELRERVKVPDDKATDDEWKDFASKKLGAPPDVAGYAIPDDIKGRARSDLEQLRESAVSAAMPKRSWDKLVKDHAARATQADQASETQINERIKKGLKEKFGDEADAALQRVEKYIEEISGSADAAARLRRDPDFVNIVASFDKILSDDPLPQNRGGGADGGAINDFYSAAKRAEQLGRNPDLYNSGAAGYPELKRQFDAAMRVVTAAGFKSLDSAIAAGRITNRKKK